MARPLMEATAREAVGQTGLDPLTILAALELLIPLFRACAGGPETAAGWLRGEDILIPLGKRARVRWREGRVRQELGRKVKDPLVVGRLVERLRRATPLEMVALYHEAKA
jgi:hypothetical protein